MRYSGAELQHSLSSSGKLFYPYITLPLTLFLTLPLKLNTWNRVDFAVSTSHSAYVATSTELHGVKIDGFLYPNFI
jgi:hypothetical protein